MGEGGRFMKRRMMDPRPIQTMPNYIGFSILLWPGPIPDRKVTEARAFTGPKDPLSKDPRTEITGRRMDPSKMTHHVSGTGVQKRSYSWKGVPEKWSFRCDEDCIDKEKVVPGFYF